MTDAVRIHGWPVRRPRSPSPLFLVLVLLVVVTALAGGGAAAASSAEEPAADSTPDVGGDAGSGKCETESDLNFDTCDLEHLPTPELIRICGRVGLDVEKHVFPLLEGQDEEDLEGLLDDLGLGGKNKGGDDAASAPGGEAAEKVGEGAEESAFEADGGGASAQKHEKERTHSDYVSAARECLLLESEIDRLEADDPDALAELERSLLAEDPDLLAEVVGDVLKRSPELVRELQIELEKEDPDLYRELMGELEEGETFDDRPELLAELVAVMLNEDPELLDKLDEELAEMMMEEEGDDGGEDGKGVVGEDAAKEEL